MSDRKPTDYELMQKLARQMAKERLEREKAARRMAEKATPPQATDSTRNASDQTTVIRKDDLRRTARPLPETVQDAMSSNSMISLPLNRNLWAAERRSMRRKLRPRRKPTERRNFLLAEKRRIPAARCRHRNGRDRMRKRAASKRSFIISGMLIRSSMRSSTI